MTLLDLRSLMDKYLVADLDAYDGTAPTSGQKDTVLNRSLRLVGQALYLYKNDVLLTLVNTQQTYDYDGGDFAQVMLDVDAVHYNGAFLRDFTRKIGVFTVPQFDARFPSWRAATAGEPTAVCSNGKSLIFDKPANTTAAGNDCYARGRVLPIALSGDSSVPEIPEHCHEIIAMLGAIIYAMPTATVDEQWFRLQNYQANTMDVLMTTFKRQFRAAHGRDPDSDRMRESCSVYRVVEGGGR